MGRKINPRGAPSLLFPGSEQGEVPGLQNKLVFEAEVFKTSACETKTRVYLISSERGRLATNAPIACLAECV